MKRFDKAHSDVPMSQATGDNECEILYSHNYFFNKMKEKSISAVRSNSGLYNPALKIQQSSDWLD